MSHNYINAGLITSKLLIKLWEINESEKLLCTYPYLVLLCVESLWKVVSAYISRTLSVYTNTVSVVCLVQAGPVGANVCVHV